MRSTFRVRVVLATAALSLALVVAASARSGGSSWSRISGPKQSGQQLGLVRTADGTLHVIWNRGNPSTTIYDTRFSAAGSKLGTTTVASNWGGDEGLALLVSGITIAGKGGVYVQQVLPSMGPQVVLPGGSITNGEAGISGRIGAAGVYVAYSDNGAQDVKSPAFHLYRYGGPTRTIARGAFSMTKVFAGAEGRLWLAWGDAKDGLFVTRTSKAAGSLEPVQKLKLPAGTSTLWNAQGEGSAGALDLFVDVNIDATGERGFWHVHVLPLLKASASTASAKGKPSTVTVRVSDAGDPVAGASVKIGAQSHTTDASGKVVFSLPAHKTVHGTVSAGGHQQSSLTVHS